MRGAAKRFFHVVMFYVVMFYAVMLSEAKHLMLHKFIAPPQIKIHVILSEARTSRSEVPAQSKAPYVSSSPSPLTPRRKHMFQVVMLSKAKHLMPHKFIPLRVTYSCVHRTRF
jgi:hypothetical protein